MFSVGCLLLGHDDMMARAAGRMWLRCQHCGRDTPGWTVGPGRTRFTMKSFVRHSLEVSPRSTPDTDGSMAEARTRKRRALLQ